MSLAVAPPQPHERAPRGETHHEDVPVDDEEDEEEDDDDDAGSLVDFIVDDEEEGEEEDEDEGEEEGEEEGEDGARSEPPPRTEAEALQRDMDGIDASNIVLGKRTRRSTQFYDRQVFSTAEYRRMMLEDVPADEMHALAESEDEDSDSEESEEEDGSFEPSDDDAEDGASVGDGDDADARPSSPVV